MNERELPKNERPPSLEAASETPMPPETRPDERIEDLDRRIDALSTDARPPERIGELAAEREVRMTGELSSIEATLGGPVSGESRAMVRERMVHEPVAFAAAQHERLESARGEREELRLEAALDEMIPYGSNEMEERIARMEGRPLVFPDSADARYAVIGTSHTSDPENPMIGGIREARDAFLRENDIEETVIMVEGMHGGMDAATLAKEMEGVVGEDDAVRKFGESGVVLWTAFEASKAGKKVEIESPERAEEEIAGEMTKNGYSGDEIGLYLTIRQFTSDIGREGRASMPDEQSALDFARSFYHFDKVSGADWISKETKADVDRAITAKDVDTVKTLVPRLLEEFAAGANVAFGKLAGSEGRKLIPSVDALIQRNEGVPDDRKVPMDAVNDLSGANAEGGRLNRLSAAWNAERDKHLVRRIQDAKKRGKKPLAVFGASHAIAIEPALKKLDDVE